MGLCCAAGRPGQAWEGRGGNGWKKKCEEKVGKRRVGGEVWKEERLVKRRVGEESVRVVTADGRWEDRKEMPWDTVGSKGTEGRKAVWWL
jgi:hypothetical protein